jgi:hypothetical protein
MIEVQSDILPTADKLSKKNRSNVTAITMASSENACASFDRSVSMMAYGEAVRLGIHGLSTPLAYYRCRTIDSEEPDVIDIRDACART